MRVSLILPLSISVFTFSVLTLVQLIMKEPFMLLERIFIGGGWIQAGLVSIFAFILGYKMQDEKKTLIWRRRSWAIFSGVFFFQLFLGLFVSDIFLMTGKLHLPVPAMILAGPIYRGSLSVMTILFVSTVVLSGPAWCSHICYFGGIDSYFSQKKTSIHPFKHKTGIKSTVLIMVIFAAIILRWLEFNSIMVLAIAVSFGVGGIITILLISRRKGKMFHCIMYCPIGTIVNLFKFISPFRMYIDRNCTTCLKCVSFCKYDALNPENIIDHKPGLTCTYCGDCISACNQNSIKYKFFKLAPALSRNIYLFISISLFSVTLALARI